MTPNPPPSSASASLTRKAIARKVKRSLDLPYYNTNDNRDARMDQEQQARQKDRHKRRQPSQGDKTRIEALQAEVTELNEQFQKPWAEQHRLLNEIKSLKASKESTITMSQATITAKDVELADVRQTLQQVQADGLAKDQSLIKINAKLSAAEAELNKVQSLHVELEARIAEIQIQYQTQLKFQNIQNDTSLILKESEVQRAKDEQGQMWKKHETECTELTEELRNTKEQLAGYELMFPVVQSEARHEHQPLSSFDQAFSGPGFSTTFQSVATPSSYQYPQSNMQLNDLANYIQSPFTTLYPSQKTTWYTAG